MIGCGVFDQFAPSFLSLLELLHPTVRWGLGQAAGQGWQIAASAALSGYRPSRASGFLSNIIQRDDFYSVIAIHIPGKKWIST